MTTPQGLVASLRADADALETCVRSGILSPDDEVNQVARLTMLLAAANLIENMTRWKAEQLAVEASWDCQAVGKALGLTLGASIRPAILPGILKLREALEEIAAQKTTAELEADHKALLDDYGAHDFEGAYDTMIRKARGALGKTPHLPDAK